VSDPATPNELKRPHLEAHYEDPVEGACRHLVADRMGITGARWGLDGAQAMLWLRAIYASGDTDAYWAYHLAREHQRNHPRTRSSYQLAA
jgi:hypothetical protein